MSETYQMEEKGLLRVQDIILNIDCGWQGIEHKNDKGVDGFVILRKNNYDTGGLVFVQVKTGSSYRYDFKDDNERFGINLTPEHLKRWKTYWKTLPGPVILLFVDNTKLDAKNNMKVWWVDLKDEKVYSTKNKGQIFVDRKQRFGTHSKGDLFKLCGRCPIERTLYKIKAEKEMISLYNLTLPIRSQARLFYKQWAQESNNANNKVIINRTGWRHITRRSRPVERIIISFQLLGIAKELINLYNNNKINSIYLRNIESLDNQNQIKNVSFIGLRSKVSFSSRSDAVVQVILKKSVIFDKNKEVSFVKIWFYSVHELKRGHKLLKE